jgi:hypothetical protein
MIRLRSLIFLLVFLLVACGQGQVQEALPTPTRDPLAFFAPTAISPGQPGNPLEIIYVPPVPDAPDVATAAQTLAGLLSGRSGLQVRVTTVLTHAEALAALCDPNDGDRFPAAWLNGPAAVFAEAQGCGERVLTATFNGEIGFAGEVVAATPGSLGSLVGRSLCEFEATGFETFYNQTLPTLALQASSIDLTRLLSIEVVPRDFAFQSLQDGTCYAMGVPAGSVPADEGLTTIYTSPVIPIGTLFVPDEMVIADEGALIQAYLEIGGWQDPNTVEVVDGATVTPLPTMPPVPEEATEPQPFYLEGVNPLRLSSEGVALTWLVGGHEIRPAAPEDLEDMREFMTDAGFDLESINLR